MSLKRVKSRSGAESPFRCCLRHPRADQREAPECGKLGRLSPLRKVLTLVLVLVGGTGADHRSPTNGRRESSPIMRCTWGGSLGRVCAWRVACPEPLRYRIGFGPGDPGPRARRAAANSSGSEVIPGTTRRE